MAATERGNRDLQQKMKKQAACSTDPLEKFRATLLSRGAHGIMGLGRSFKIIDDDGSRSIDFSEFCKAVGSYGCGFTKVETKELFEQLDKDGGGVIDFDEFLIACRPPMSKARLSLINQAFTKVDKTGDGKLTVEDLKGVYNVSKHPKFLNGEWTEDQCLKTFLDTFDDPNNKDGCITKDEWENYYAGVSASIDLDSYFDLMMRNAWKL